MTEIDISREAVERRKVSLPEVPSSEDDEVIFSEGVTYAIQVVAEMIGVHPDEFSWDAATEEFEGDVRSVVGNMLAVVSEEPLRAALDAAEREKAEAVAGAYLAAASYGADMSYDPDEFERLIQGLTPADARAALDARIAGAVAEINGYCTDCEAATIIGDDGRGSCGHGRVVPFNAIFALIIRAAEVDEAVAAERERCAHIAERFCEEYAADAYDSENEAGRLQNAAKTYAAGDIAAAIRSGEDTD